MVLRYSFLLAFSFILLFSCKSKNNKKLQNLSSIEETNTLSSTNTENNKNAPDFGIHLFEDDERIYNFPEGYLESTLADYKTTATPPPGTSMESLDPDIFYTLLAYQIEDAAAQNLHDIIEKTKEEGLGLFGLKVPWTLKTEMSVKKGAARSAEDLRWALYTFQSKASLLLGKKGATGNPAHDYFYKAVQKKWENKDGSFHHFNMMPAKIKSDVQFKKEDGTVVTPEYGEIGSVYLSMIPNQAILNAFRSESNYSRFNIISMVEEFELQEAQRVIKASNPTLTDDLYKRKTKTDTSDPHRYIMELEVQPGASSELGIDNWTQFSTPDRNMMTGEIAEAAIDKLVSYMKDNKVALLHCKSGQGRSASIVLGAYSDLVLKDAKKAKARIDRKTIDAVIDEQLALIKEARPEVNISPLQLLNIRKILYKRYGLLE